MDGEIMKRANLLVKSKGQGALEYANKMLEEIEETGDDEEKTYWHRIALQVELLVEQNYP